MPPLTQGLVVVNVVVFLSLQQAGGEIVGWLALWPPGSGLFMPWQLFTYAFLHANLMHLAFNMFGVWMFGSALEQVWGARRLAMFYVVCVLTAAGAQLLVTTLAGSVTPTVGASGGLFGMLVGFAMLFPQRTVRLLFPPVPMPAWLFVTLYGVVELTLGVTGSASGVAHFAHLGGLAGGWCMVRYWRGQPPFASRRR